MERKLVPSKSEVYLPSGSGYIEKYQLYVNCPFCGYYCVLGKGREDVCVHLKDEAPDGRYLIFDNKR